MQNQKIVAISWWWFLQLDCAIKILQIAADFLAKSEIAGLHTATQSPPELQAFLDKIVWKNCNTGVDSLQSAKQHFLTVENLQWPRAINCSRSKLIENSTIDHRGVSTPWCILHQQLFLETNLGQLTGVFIAGEYTGKSILHRDEYTRESRLYDGESTGELITNTNNSSNIRKKIEIVSTHVKGTRGRCTT